MSFGAQPALLLLNSRLGMLGHVHGLAPDLRTGKGSGRNSWARGISRHGIAWVYILLRKRLLWGGRGVVI